MFFLQSGLAEPTPHDSPWLLVLVSRNYNMRVMAPAQHRKKSRLSLCRLSLE